MAGLKWSLWRRFRTLKLWTRIGVVGSLASIFGLGLYFIPSSKKVELTDEQLEIITESGAKSDEVKELLYSIQEERNEAINDSAQVEFIEVISNIYRTIDSTATIKLNEETIDKTGEKYRSDLTIKQKLAGHDVKLLFRLNPYENPLGKSEILSFQNHIEAIGASKGIIIS